MISGQRAYEIARVPSRRGRDAADGSLDRTMILRVMHKAAVAFGALVLAVGLITSGAGLAGASAGRITVHRTAVVTGPPSSSATWRASRAAPRSFADVDLGPAPSAGAPRRLEGDAILRRLQEAGMDASATRYVIPASVRVERTSQEVSVDEIRTAVLNIAGDALPAGDHPRSRVAGPVRIPAGAYEARVSAAPTDGPDVQLVQGRC
jgi:hypothetical protein